MFQRGCLGIWGCFVLAILMIACTGCLRSRGEVIVNSLPPDLRLDRENTLRLRVISDLENAEDACLEIRGMLSAMLQERRVFREVVFGENHEEVQADMALEVKIVTLRKVGTMSRLLLGDVKGQARVVAECRLFSEKEGHEVGSFIAEGESSLKGIFSELSGTTKQALKRASEAMAAILEGRVK